MNYEDMSDHEINMAVTCIENNCQGWATTASNTGFYHCGIDGGGFYEVECVDYCSNPSDAWAIIVKSKIGITPSCEKWMANNFNPSNSGWIHVQTMHYDKNPLRAAMICFLKMKDAESE